jgi:hypothetical protein
MHGVGVGLGIDRDGLHMFSSRQARMMRTGDFAAIGDQDFLKHGDWGGR